MRKATHKSSPTRAVAGNRRLRSRVEDRDTGRGGRVQPRAWEPRAPLTRIRTSDSDRGSPSDDVRARTSRRAGERRPRRVSHGIRRGDGSLCPRRVRSSGPRPRSVCREARAGHRPRCRLARWPRLRWPRSGNRPRGRTGGALTAAPETDGDALGVLQAGPVGHRKDRFRRRIPPRHALRPRRSLRRRRGAVGMLMIVMAQDDGPGDGFRAAGFRRSSEAVPW